MAGKSEKAAAAVEAFFKRKPTASTDEFLEVAIAADPSLRGVGKRSFNATYMIPIKRGKVTAKRGRKKKVGRPKGSTTRKTRGARRGRPPSTSQVGGAARGRLRDLILERDRMVLRALSGQGDPRAAYDLAADLDTYINQLASAMGR